MAVQKDNLIQDNLIQDSPVQFEEPIPDLPIPILTLLWYLDFLNRLDELD